MKNPYPTFPPLRWRPVRISLVVLSSLALIGGFAIFATTYNPQATRWIPVLMVLGVLWRAMAYFWPDAWLPRWPGPGRISPAGSK